ncbi:MAG: succinate dehydrogenase, hydrophobic membrane anchor protein [Methylococcaceae bacterium]|nr:succinate dehydrogenase, hydrophobic membrane anchor protein [Methylococcaceae bacterium]
MNFRTPISKARGLGSAKAGFQHWWTQRITAVALIPLTLWFGIAIILVPGADHRTIVEWISSPWNTVLLIATIIAVFYHALLGIQVIIEDYIRTEWLKIAAILATKLILIFYALAALYATFRIVTLG